jgi:hypothetical protein
MTRSAPRPAQARGAQAPPPAASATGPRPRRRAARTPASGQAHGAPRPVAETRRGRGGQAGGDLMAGDHGLFGPGSATWQLMGEPVL